MASQKYLAKAMKRLSDEMRTYHNVENKTFLYLRPINADDMLLWEAVLKGPDDTPYEGKFTNPKFPIVAIPVNLMRQQVDFGTSVLKCRKITLLRRRPSTSRLR